MRWTDDRKNKRADTCCQGLQGTNMFDTNMVQVIANEMKFYELVIFIEEHKGDYAKFILTGEC